MSWDVVEVLRPHDGMTLGYVFRCSTDGVVFGPIMDSETEANEFAEALVMDPRKVGGEALRRKYQLWKAQREEFAE